MYVYSYAKMRAGRVISATRRVRCTRHYSMASTPLPVLIFSGTRKVLLNANSSSGLHFSSVVRRLSSSRSAAAIAIRPAPFVLRSLRRQTTSSLIACSLGRSSYGCCRLLAGLPSLPSVAVGSKTGGHLLWPAYLSTSVPDSTPWSSWSHVNCGRNRTPGFSTLHYLFDLSGSRIHPFGEPSVVVSGHCFFGDLLGV